MAERRTKSLGKSGRVSRAKARVVAKTIKAKRVPSRKAVPKAITVKQTATGKGLITFRIEEVLKRFASQKE